MRNYNNEVLRRIREVKRSILPTRGKRVSDLRKLESLVNSLLNDHTYKFEKEDQRPDLRDNINKFLFVGSPTSIESTGGARCKDTASINWNRIVHDFKKPTTLDSSSTPSRSMGTGTE